MPGLPEQRPVRPGRAGLGKVRLEDVRAAAHLLQAARPGHRVQSGISNNNFLIKNMFLWEIVFLNSFRSST